MSVNSNYTKYIIFILFIHLNSISFVYSSYFFKEANARVSKALENDRPCNFMLAFNDAQLSTTEIIHKYGYPAERHWVTTEDGYILEIHRIPKRVINNFTAMQIPGKKINETQTRPRGESQERKPVVFLIHGVLGTSRDFVINCERRALAFQLWENGYDVWMGNYRGNKYGRNHTNLTVDNLKFWDFSADEIGYYDIPATIDYILNITNLKALSVVGHSMGNVVTIMMLSNRPEYNDKVNILYTMAVALTYTSFKSPPLKILSNFPRTIEWLLTTFNHGELFPETSLKFFNKYVSLLCRREGREVGSYHGFCSTLNFLHDGYDPGQISPKLYSVIFGGFPSSSSVKVLVHWMQWIINEKFTMFDKGRKNNLQKYGSVKPKLYSLENLRTPIVLLYGQSDWLSAAPDVLRTKALLERSTLHPVECVKVEPPSWNHLDFLYGKDADIFVYGHILDRIKLVYQNIGSVN